MRGERATLGKSLLDVQRELKIKATYIAAIENADPTVFETQGFIAGYVRSYARYLDLDPDWAYTRFCQESGFAVAHGMSPAASVKRAANVKAPVAGKSKDPFADPNATFVPRGQGLLSKIEPGALGSMAVLVALVAGLGYGGWSVLQEIQKVQLAPVDQAPGVVADTTPMRDQIDVTVAGLDDSLGIEAPSADALDRLYRPQALDVPVLVPRDGPIATIDPRTIGALAVPAAENRLEALSAEMVAAAAAADGGVQVVEEDAPELALVAVRPSWVRVQAADGSILFEKILDAGERYVVPAMEQPPVLRTGNAGGVFFAVAGQAYGPVGENGSVVKNIALLKDSVSTNFAPVDLARNAPVCEMFQVASTADLSCN